MKIKKNKDTFQVLSSVWTDLTGWLKEIETKHTKTFEAAINKGLEETTLWYSEHPFGSIPNRSSHALIFFLDELDKELSERNAKPKCIEMLEREITGNRK